MKIQHGVFDIRTGETKIETVDVDSDDPVEMMKQLLHDCPECRAAMERGEQPKIVTGEEMKQRVERMNRRRRWRQPKWR